MWRGNITQVADPAGAERRERTASLGPEKVLQYPVQYWKCIGSLQAPLQSPPQVNPERLNAATTPAGMSPSRPMALVSGLRSTARPQAWVESLLLERLARKLKQPPKLRTLALSPRRSISANTSWNFAVSRRWQ